MAANSKPVARPARREAAPAKARPKAKDSMEQMLQSHPELKTTLAQIEKQFGQGAIMPLGANKTVAVEGIPTGSLSLDIALGGQGMPKGRIVEIFGPESSGKTTLALHVVANAQRAGGIAAFVDAEHALDPAWAKKVGVQLDSLLVSQPGSGEEAMRITEMLIRSNAVDVIIVDSVAALVPKQELEGDIGDSHVGLQARLMSQAMRKLTGAIAKSKTCVIFINQIREKVGVMYGNPEVTTGGRALKFYSSIRLDVRRKGQPIKKGDQPIANVVRVKVTKNKLAPPFREAELELYFGRGIDPVADLVTVAADQGVIQKSGSWFSYGDIRLGQGKEKAADYLRENPELIEEIRAKVLGQDTEDAEAGPDEA